MTVIGKKEHLLETALRLFAAEGLAVPTSQIAKTAGVANGTLFNHFPTKQNLIDTLYLETKTEVVQVFLAGGARTAGSLKQSSFVIWNGYIRWAIKHPLKHRVMNLFNTAQVLSPEVVAKVDDLLKPLYELVQKGISSGEIVDIGFDYLYQIKAAQMVVAIDQALARRLKGKALEAHIRTGFQIYWKGVAA